VADSLDALIDREQGPDGEQHHGHDERVEVALTAEAELVFLGLLAQGALAAEQQQDLVA
jgi:hypothetical protein